MKLDASDFKVQTLLNTFWPRHGNSNSTSKCTTHKGIASWCADVNHHRKASTASWYTNMLLDSDGHRKYIILVSITSF